MANQGVLEELKVVPYGTRRHFGIAADIGEADLLADRKRGNIQKPRELAKVSHVRFLLDLFFEVRPHVVVELLFRRVRL